MKGEGRPRREGSADSSPSDRATNLFRGSRAERLRFYVLLTFLVLCALGGGASRPDVLSLLYLRPAAILSLVALVLSPGGFEFGRFRTLFGLFGLLALSIAVQLIPLPPEVWAELPGHARFAGEATAAGIPLPWRPLSLTPDLTLNSLLALLPPLVILVGLAAIREDQRQGLLLVLICLVLADAGWSVVQFASGANSATYLYEVTNQGTPVGLFANRNHHAALLALGFPMLALWLRMPSPSRERLRTRRWMSAAIGMFLIPVILATGSRAGVIAGAAGIMFALFLAPSNKAARGRRQRIAQASLWLLPIALVLITVLASRAVSLQRFFGDDGTGGAGEARLEALPILSRMVRDFFPLGTGHGAFDPAYRIYEPDSLLGPTYLNHAHNDLVELALTGGAAGLLVLALFVIWWAAASGRWLLRYDGKLLSADFARLGAIMILLLLGASLVDYPLRTPTLAVVFTIACGWLSLAFPTSRGVGAEAHAPPGRRRRGRTWIGALALCLPLAALLLWIAMGVTAARTIGRAEPGAVLSWWPYDADAHAIEANLLIQTHPDRQSLGEAAGLARDAIRRDPTNVAALRALALVAAVRGEMPAAERLMSFSETLSRRDLATQLWLIEANVQSNNIEGALHHYDRALRTSLVAGEMLFPVLVDASASPDVLMPVARLVGARPIWWTDFARKLVADSRSPVAIATILSALHLDPHIVAERDLLVAAFNRLIAAGAYAPAFALYRRATRLPDNSPALILRNGDFQADNSIPPFDWALVDQSDLAARIEAPAVGGNDLALVFSASEGTSGEVARQFIVLPPGQYRMTARAGNVSGEPRELPQILVSCAADPRNVLDLHLQPSPATGAAISQDFDVPANCPGQWLSIRANGPMNGAGPESWIDSIAIGRRG